MRIYYRAPDVVVTSELFVRHGPSPGRFAIRDLRDVGIAPAVPEGVRPGIVVLPAAAAVLVAAAVVSVAGGVLVAVAIAVSACAAGMVFAMVHQHRPRRWELRATYEGREVTLYASADDRVFNQVGRALLRAIEAGRQWPPHTNGAAAA
ncbi:DUF6232 family protein [Actinoplanes sp. CA-142083]|uniref:DUF6232 family protein n=1 Tax=Actinoplanes sp. CA-142083 TaxID=3239903 RepID=UPI003D8E02EF